MASTKNSKELADLRNFAKFVDELYFPLSGLPPMSVFVGATSTVPPLQTVNLDISPHLASNHPTPIPNQFSSHDISPTSSDVEQNKKRKIVKSPRKNEFCQFCKNNGELERVYLSHKLKDKRNRIQCPRLREYKCKICGESGDNAHTYLHCPQRESNIFKEYLSSQPLSAKILL